MADLTATLQLEIFAPATAGYEARSLTTEFALQISLTPTVDPLDAVDDFLAAIEAGDFNWFTNTIDWDNDGITNPYDWTPTLGVNLLAFQSPDGSATDPWPIYNVWQLQAIDGISVSDAGVVDTNVTISLFGDDAATRLAAEYRLATNIDATPTKIWDSNKGFNPIGDGSDEFNGFMDGRGYAVRGLFIDRAANNIGLFGYILKSGEFAVSDLGVEDADISGQGDVGIVVGVIEEASLRRVWTTGKVVGSGNRVGGLSGLFTASTGKAVGETSMNWSTADVRGDSNVGGLFGRFFSGNAILRSSDSWAAGDVSGNDNVAGVIGTAENSRHSRAWAGGAISSDGVVGGFAAFSPDGFVSYTNTYWNLDTSGGVTESENNNSFGVARGAVMQALTDSDFGGEAESAAWSFGDNDLSDGDGDFPLLVVHSQPWQAVNLARVLARPVGVVAGLEPIAAVAGATLTATRVRLDTNGLAADINSIRTSTPTCAFDPVSRVLQAETNYNNVAIEMTLLADGGEKLIAASDCEVAFEDATNGEFAATLRLIISAPAIGDDETRILTKDYPLHIDPDPTPDPLAAARAARSEFMAALAAGDFNWFTNTIDWDNDGTANPYDWTPTVGVSLLLDGEDGTAGNPWPIYNVWQLQAIDGVSVSQTGETGTSDIFGDDAATRLGAEYRLATNIDATQTEIWDGKKGFNPIGGDGDNNRFTGFFDGRGYAVRNLFINRPSDINVGLFARIYKDGELAVTDLGVEKADIRGEGFGRGFGGVGILVGEAEGNFHRVWTTGKVFGSRGIVGGIIGLFNTTDSTAVPSAMMMSWSTADVSGDDRVGGLLGLQSDGSTRDIASIDNWAAGNVSGNGDNVGGYTGGYASQSDLIRNWSARGGFERFGRFGCGRFCGSGFLRPALTVLSKNNYWNLDTSAQTDSATGEGVALQTLIASNFGGNVALNWQLGDSDISDAAADFPLLNDLSRPWQAVNLARALTRLLALDGAEIVAGTTVTTGGIRLDTNGLAPNRRAGGTSAPTCSFDAASRVFRAETNYNGVTIDLSFLTADGNKRFVTARTANCEVGIRSEAEQFAATLRLEIFAPAIGVYAARAMTTEFALQITLADSTAPTNPLRIVELSEPATVAAHAIKGANVLTVTATGDLNPSIEAASDGNFETTGGAEAKIVLSKAATAAFKSDNLTLSLALRATNSDGDTETAEFQFVSAPRAINPDPIVRKLVVADATGSAVILREGESKLSIWHYDGAEKYVFVGDGSEFIYFENSEFIQIAAGGFGVGNYDFELELRGGDLLTATLSVQVQVTEKPQLEIASIPDPVIVAANAIARGIAILTLTVSGVENASFAATMNDNFETGGGAEAFITLARAATQVFNEDNLTHEFVLTVSADDDAAATVTVKFASAPRVFSRGELAINLALADAELGDEVLAADASLLSIWHNGDAETYSIETASENFDVDPATGLVSITAALSAGVEHLITLRLTDDNVESLQATRVLRVNALADNQAVLANFVAAIAADDFNWFANTIDWDDDGIANPYDWTPTVNAAGVTINLTLNGADGSSTDPWPIYNVWQLQAIDGISVSDAGATLGGMTLFGDDAATRLGAQYRLALDIDATPTKEWDGKKGFNPIAVGGVSDEFTGFFDGDNNVVRGLFIDRPSDDYVGLFASIDKTSELAVRDLGVEDADIRGGGLVGIIAGEIDEAGLSVVWTTGKVVGSGNNVGGLVGEANNNDGGDKGFIKMSWSTADVKGRNAVGGIAGFNDTASSSSDIDDNWAAGNVIGDEAVGGFSGLINNADHLRNWSAGAVSGATDVGGFVGGNFLDVVEIAYAAVYWNLDTSGVSVSQGDSANGSVVLQTLVASNFADSDGDETAANAAWDFGDSDISDDDADFPLLKSHSQPWQAINLARALTRILGVSDAATITAAAGMSFTTDQIRLDTNGRAPDTRADGTSTPSCSFDPASRVLRAATNYNGVTVDLSLLNDGPEVFVAVDTTQTHCQIGFQNVNNGFFDATLRLEISAPATAGYEARSLTKDYALRIVSQAARAAQNQFVADIAAGDIDWFSTVGIVGAGTSIDWDGDGVANPYDWTPTSVVIDGETVEVNLILDGADGSAANPWPVFNVWQLQAIDGMSVSHLGAMSGGLALFGGSNDARLGRRYRLQVDIDATPTRAWDSGKGFNPIGLFSLAQNLIFRGVFDGGGNVVRGLFIGGRGDPHTGLIAYASGSVVSVGLDDVYVSGGADNEEGFGSGALVGGLIGGGLVSESWARGEIIGHTGAGGLIGALGTGGGAATVSASWFAGRVVSRAGGFALAGGLLGQMNNAGAAVIDSWAASDIAIAANVNNAHEILSNHLGGSLTRLWGESFWRDGINRDDISSSAQTQTYYSDIITLSVSNFGGMSIWNTGTDTDYPVLTVHSRNLQAAALAAGLSRVVGINGVTVAATREREIDDGQLGEEFEAIRIERINDDIPALACAFSDGALRAQMGYNMATAIIELIAFDAELAQRGDADSCETDILNNSGGDATLRFIYASRIDPAAPEARLTTDYNLTIALDPDGAARSEFVREIEAVDFNWFASRAGAADPLDWDNDGIENRYDYTPASVAIGAMTVEVNLTLRGVPDGSAGAPWPIYNVWQLQAIDGISVSDAGVTTGGFVLFGDSEDERLAAEYVLAADIDATPTKIWDGNKGFNPIGGGGAFAGFFDGNDKVVRGLVIDRAGEDNVGLFGKIGKVSELAVRDLGIADAEISGGSAVGILAGEADSDLNNVWTTGKVNGGNNVGGVVGVFAGDSDTKGNTIMTSWSAAHVSASGDRVGGFIGRDTSIQTSEIVDSWAVGDVSGDEEVGGFAGLSFNFINTRNWSAGAVSGGATVGGFDTRSTDFPFDEYNSVYWNEDTSEQTDSGGGDGVVVQTLAASNFGGNAESAAWDFGDSDISNGDADFPLLKSSSQPWQAVNVARALTRFLALDGATIVAGTTVTTGGIRLDTNGRADDDKTTAGTSVPTCSFENINDEGVLRAQTNYNGVMVDLRLLTGGDEKFVAATAEKTENCEVAIQSDAVEFAATLRLEISAPATAGHPARSLTTDYALQITLAESTLPSDDSLMIDAPSEAVIVAANADAGGVAILTVSLSGGIDPSFAAATNDNFETGGGAEAFITLARAATEVFNEDNAMREFVLTASADAVGGGTETATATVRFVSAPRAISQNLRLVVNLNYSAVAADADVLMAGDAGIAVWHIAGDKTYTLGGDNADLFDVDAGTGEVMVGGDALTAGETYNFVLQLTGGGLTAMREIRVIVSAAPLMIDPIPGTVIVAANAGAGGVAILTVSLSGGTNPSFAAATNDNFETGGGAEAFITLARAATEVFNEDNAMREFALTASGGGAATVTAQFASAPRVISQGELPINLAVANAASGDEVLAADESLLSIWHNGGNAETYSIETASENFDVDPMTGLVSITVALLVGEEHAITLRLTDDDDGGLQATRILRVNVLADEQAAARAAALADFVAAIAADDFNWFANTVDWDNDGTVNVYDWTPTVNAAGVTINLTLNGADGSSTDPWPIYNVWQLQAIDGISVSDAGEVDGNVVMSLFGDDAAARLGAEYRLAINIDATPTREWDKDDEIQFRRIQSHRRRFHRIY